MSKVPKHRRPGMEVKSNLRRFLVPLADDYGRGVVAQRKWKLADFNEGRIYRWVVYRYGVPHQVFAHGDLNYRQFWVASVVAVEAMCETLYRMANR